MKNTKLVAMLVLQAVLVMGILSHVNAEFFPKCCDICRFESMAVFCDDTHPTCPKGCLTCRQVQQTPIKRFRCNDPRDDDGTPCLPCKTY